MIQPHESLGDDTGLIQPVVQETGSNTEVVVPDTTTGEQAGAVLDLAGAEFDLTKLPTVSSGFNTHKVGLSAFFADLDAGYSVQPVTEVVKAPLGQTDYTGRFIKPIHELDDSTLYLGYRSPYGENFVSPPRIIDSRDITPKTLYSRDIEERYSGEEDLDYARTSHVNPSHTYTPPENPELFPHRIDRSWTPGEGLEGGNQYQIPMTQFEKQLVAFRDPITGIYDFVRVPIELNYEVKPDKSTDHSTEEPAEPDTADDTEQ